MGTELRLLSCYLTHTFYRTAIHVLQIHTTEINGKSKFPRSALKISPKIFCILGNFLCTSIIKIKALHFYIVMLLSLSLHLFSNFHQKILQYFTNSSALFFTTYFRAGVFKPILQVGRGMIPVSVLDQIGKWTISCRGNTVPIYCRKLCFLISLLVNNTIHCLFPFSVIKRYRTFSSLSVILCLQPGPDLLKLNIAIYYSQKKDIRQKQISYFPEICQICAFLKLPNQFTNVGILIHIFRACSYPGTGGLVHEYSQEQPPSRPHPLRR